MHVVYCGREGSSCQETAEVSLSSGALHALKNRQVRALNASSTLWYPSPITTRPSKPSFSTLSWAVRFWYGGWGVGGAGTAILKVGQSAHLTSFPNTVLCLLQEILLIGVRLKKGFWLEGQVDKGRSELPQRCLKEKISAAWAPTLVSQIVFN